MSQPEFSSVVFPLRPAGGRPSEASVSVVFRVGGPLLETSAPAAGKFFPTSHFCVCLLCLPFIFGTALPLAVAISRKKKFRLEGHLLMERRKNLNPEGQR